MSGSTQERPPCATVVWSVYPLALRAFRGALAADEAKAARPPRYDCDGGLRRPHPASPQKRKPLERNSSLW